MSRLFGYSSAAVDRDAAALEAFENKKIEAKENYWLEFNIFLDNKTNLLINISDTDFNNFLFIIK